MSDELRAEYEFDCRQGEPNRFATDGAQSYPTEHPHVERRPGVCGGAPVIRGTRITVRHIAVLHKDGATIQEMLETYPHLQASWVHDAISYYLDHREQIEREIEANRIEAVLARTNGTMDDKGVIRFPAGWDAERVKRLIDHYDSMSEEELAAEDEAAVQERKGQTVITVPDELLPAIRKLLAGHKAG